jgi:hypothetical protein
MPSGQIVLERLFACARFPHLNPLMERLAIRLARKKTTGKSLVIPLAREEANERGNF